MTTYLDEIEEPDPTPNSFIELMFTWEKNRVIFNLVLGAIGLIMYLVEKSLTNHGSHYWVIYWREARMVGLLSNVCFSLIYVVEIANMIFTKLYFSKSKRIQVLKIGLLFCSLGTITLGVLSIIKYG
jgi:hypothetical protein